MIKSRKLRNLTRLRLQSCISLLKTLSIKWIKKWLKWSMRCLISYSTQIKLSLKKGWTKRIYNWTNFSWESICLSEKSSSTKIRMKQNGTMIRCSMHSQAIKKHMKNLKSKNLTKSTHTITPLGPKMLRTLSLIISLQLNKLKLNSIARS